MDEFTTVKMRIALAFLLFNFFNFVRAESSAVCCKQYTKYIECYDCRNIPFFVAKDVSVKLMSTRTNSLSVVRGSIKTLRVKTEWQYNNLCTLHVWYISRGKKTKSCGKYCFFVLKKKYFPGYNYLFVIDRQANKIALKS